MENDAATARPPRPKWSRTAKWAVVGTVSLALYAIIGFLIAPPIIRAQLETILTKQLDHPVEVKEVRFNPFALSLTVRDFAVSERDRTPLLGFEELYVNVELASLINRAPTFSLIRLLHPYALVVIRKDGTLNLADLHPSPGDAPPEPPPQVDESEKTLPGVIVEVLEHEGGALEFHDYSKSTPFSADVVPITFTLQHFSTMPDSPDALSFTAEIGPGERIAWHGAIHIQPIRSEGTLTLTGIKARTIWSYIQDLVKFEITDGLVDLKADYLMQSGRNAFHAQVKQGAITITQFALGERGGTDPLIRVPEFAVEGIDADLSSRTVTISAVRTRNARIDGWMDRDGRTSFQALFAGDKREAEAAQPSPPQTAPPAATPWVVNIDQATITDYGITMEDRKPSTPVRVTINPLNLKLDHVSSKLDNPIAFDLSARVNETGTVNVKGDAIADPLALSLDLDVDKIAFLPFQPYLDEIAQLNLKSGYAGIKGRFSLRPKDGATPRMRFDGKAAVTDLLTQDKQLNKDFLKWKELAVNGIGLELDPTRVAIAEVILTRPYVRFIIGPDRTTNVQQLLVKPDTGAQAEPPPPAKGEAARPAAQQPVPVQIGAIRLVDGSTHFADFSLRPVIDTGIFALNGAVKGLSSKELSKADVSIAGKVDKYAPVFMKGTINPLTSDAFTDIAVRFQNVELTTVSPYSTKFAGYPITKGKISLDLKYKLSKKILEAENKVVINQLTLGDKIDSPDATSLPVKLAVALLKDRNGVIDIDLPVRGDLNDPDFKYGKALLGVLVNLVTKAATAPFNLVAGLVGGSADELSRVEFPAGSATLTPAEEGSLKTVGKALAERPGLRLDIGGATDDEADRAALAERKLARDLIALKTGTATSASGATSANEEFAAVPEPEQADLIKTLYLKKFGKLPEPQAGPVPTQALKTRLLDNTVVDESELRLLAQERAKRIQDFLLAQGGVQPERVFLLDARLDAQAKNGFVPSNLSLNAE